MRDLTGNAVVIYGAQTYDAEDTAYADTVGSSQREKEKTERKIHQKGGESYRLPSRKIPEMASFRWVVIFNRQINGSGRQRMTTFISRLAIASP